MFEDFKIFKVGFILYNIIYIIMTISKIENSYLILYSIFSSFLLLFIFKYEKKKKIEEILNLKKPKNVDLFYDSYIDLTFKELDIIYQNKKLNSKIISDLISLLNLKLNTLFEITKQKEQKEKEEIKTRKLSKRKT